MPDTRPATAVTIGAVAALLVAFASPGPSQPADPPQAAAASAEVAARIADAQAALERASAELEGLRAAKREFEDRLKWIESRAEVHAGGREFARALIEERARLPGPENFSAARQERARLLAATSDANMGVERALGRLGGPDGAGMPASAVEGELLARLAGVQFRLLQVLKESEAISHELQHQAEASRERLTQLLFWIPAPPELRTLASIGPSLAWTFSPANWLWARLAARPLLPALALLAAGGLLALRRNLQGALLSTAPAAVGFPNYRLRHALAALAITAGLALPVPMVMWTAGHLIAAVPDGQAFSQALSEALDRIARLALALSAFAWLLDRRGMAVAHSGWAEDAADFVARALRRFSILFVPLMLVAAMNGLDHSPPANRDSLGRLGFNVAMLGLAAFLAYLLRRKGPLIRNLLMRAPRSMAARLHRLWRGSLVALPLAMAGLAVAGYFTAAAYFFGHALQSAFLALGAVMLYGLIALWVRLQRYHLRRRQELESARPAGGKAEEEAGSEVAEVRPPELDVAALGEQTKSLLDLLITLLLLGGLWGVWKDALPVLSVVTDYELWSYASSADGARRALTVGGLALALLVAAVTAVAVRNVGALLDMVLLQRMEMAADATYAIKVVARYILAAVGIVLAARILGVAWGDVHWLIAALGVGVGFGLQEIVANFISGLILLAERPIRIGDVITVGDMSGTVARIRARATAVVDFDNKEVIIPNKAFITERVVNWTLSSRVTRLLLPFGVAYGSDIALVQRVVLEAVRGVPDVLEDPAPSVFFSAFGDSSLDFEIRAFVDSFDKRIRVRHEINFAVERALSAHGIEIPFPQRDLHIRSAPAPGGLPGAGQAS